MVAPGVVVGVRGVPGAGPGEAPALEGGPAEFRQDRPARGMGKLMREFGDDPALNAGGRVLGLPVLPKLAPGGETVADRAPGDQLAREVRVRRPYAVDILLLVRLHGRYVPHRAPVV